MKALLASALCVSLLSAAESYSFETNLVKGGEYRCYQNGDAILCFSSKCANALFEEVRNETSTAQRKSLCAQEGKKADFVGRRMLRALTDPAFVREFKGVVP